MSIDQLLGEDARSQLSTAHPATTIPVIIQEDATLTKQKNKQSPQQTVDDFWNKFIAKHPGKVHTVLPHDVYAKSKAAHGLKGITHGHATHKSYEQAVAACRAAVEKIAKECRRVNMRYRDPHFDIEFDLKRHRNECLEGLTATDDPPFKPGSVKRVPEIFDEPQFYVDDATASDIRQGCDGDCWFLSAVSAITHRPGLISRVCVARDEKVGVYGFVFHRDGEWIYTIIDDKLYLNVADYDESRDEKFNWEKVFNRQDAEEEYRRAYQTGSRALYFAQCSTENETWLPLLEKAYAKAHGDFRSIDGGFTGEGIEDLTGGVTTELFTSDILDKDQFWTEELMKVNKEFLFGCATGCFDDWQGGGATTDRKGVVAMHAYSIMEAREVKGERLLKIRNPWGKTEWKGAWSDGSEEWDPEWMQLLNHRFGNDGIFWISYKDLLKKYQSFDRTRLLFGPEWIVNQQWTTVDVPWTADYNETKFRVTLSKAGPIVIVLSQLDRRYFRGLEGQYYFSLHFRVDKDGEDDYIVRSHGNYLMIRSVSTDLELEPGTYSVLMRITAKRYTYLPKPEDIVRTYSKEKQEKLLQIGLAYDLAHAKGQNSETAQEKRQRAKENERRKNAIRKKQLEEARAMKYKEWLKTKRHKERIMREKRRVEERRQKKSKAVEKRTDDARGADTPAKDLANTQSSPSIDPPVACKVGFKVDENSKVREEVNNDPAKESQTKEPLASPPEDSKEISKFKAIADSDPIKADATKETPYQPEKLEEPSGKDRTTQSRIDEFNKNVQFAPQTNKIDDTSAHSGPAPPTDAISETDSILSFHSSIDSILDLDSIPDEVPSSDDEEEAALITAVLPGMEDANAEFAKDPWNAVCVVCLRVYSKDSGVTVEVVRPKSAEKKEQVGGGGGEAPLDVDDPSKGVSEEVAGEMESGGDVKSEL